MPALPRRSRVANLSAGGWRALLAATAVLALAGCGSGAGAPPTPTGGIDLLTMASPTCPVQRQGQL